MYYKLAQLTLGVMLKIVFRPWAAGARNVPQHGPAILASNHLSFADHFFGPLPLRRQVIFLAKAEYFTGRGIKGLISRAFFSALGQIPVDRGGGAASERAIQTGLRVLEEGKLLGIYPEGTRSPDGRLYRGKTGIARLALEGQVPVIPVAMVGTFEFMPSGQTRPNFRIRPGVRFGEPLDFSRFYGKALGPARAARGHRRGHAGHREALRPGVRRHVRPAGQGETGRGGRATANRAPASGRAARNTSGNQILRPGRRTPPRAKVAP